MVSEAEKDKMYLNWINHIPGIGRKRTCDILSGDKSPEWLYRAGIEEVKRFFAEQQGVSLHMAEILAENICRGRDLNPEEMYLAMRGRGIQLLTEKDPGYPLKLRGIPDAPVILYSVGEKVWNDTECFPAVAIVGARQCSEYGKYIARELGRACAQKSIRVVSGMACGIDAIAQRSACKEGGVVAAVLGSGADVCYPEANRNLYKCLTESGTIYSEYVPGTEPRAQNFPPRNRIISGMADVLIVVEAREKSGTLITVDMALEQGRDVCVVPGRLTDPLSSGCNRLIGQGAEVLYDMDVMLDEVLKKAGLGSCSSVTSSDFYKKMKNPYVREEVKFDIYEVLDIELMSVQRIYEKLRKKTDMDIATLQSYLLFMQMDGSIMEKDGRYAIRG